MKKMGFTLAEVLITLTIVGVVATITIPVLNARVNEQANASKLGASINSLENAFSIMVTREDKEDISQTAFGQSQTEANIKKYLSQVTLNDGTYTMKNGATFKLSSVAANAKLDIDVNGSKSPNTDGKDKFTYTLNADGTLTPTGDAIDLAKNNYKITIK